MESPESQTIEWKTKLVDLSKELLSERDLILVSNRGPVEYSFAEDGSLKASRGRGGVVTALSAVSQYAPLLWIAAAMGEADRKAGALAKGGLIKTPLSGLNLSVRFVVPHRDAYHNYYNVFSNPLLWFLQHYMWNSPFTPNITAGTYDAWERGYLPVNRAFANAVIEEAKGLQVAPFVMLHDYHLYLAANYIRQELPGAIIQHFTHIPWPAPAYWQLLPRFMRREICEGLCAADIVGMQTTRHVLNFLHTCQAVLEEAEVDYRRGTVFYEGRLTTVRAYPISIDVDGLRRQFASHQVKQYIHDLTARAGEYTIVRVDRLEPSKNIVRGYRAFDLFLQRYPEFRGKVKFLSFLVPSRTHVRQYQLYANETFKLIDEINTKYGDSNWKPIEVFHENNYPQAIAGMSLYDVMLVNPIADGMNLVAKEGPIVNSKNGVLILSEGAGAWEQMRNSVLSVAPADLEGTARAFHAALTMSQQEREEKAEAMKRAIETEDITAWLYHQFEDLRLLS